MEKANLSNFFQELVEEVADSIVADMEGSQTKKSDSKANTLAPLLRELSVKIVGILKEEVVSGGQDSQVERKLEKAADKLASGREVYPNLKYRKPKYNSMDSVLKYIEGEDDGKGGVKLVIMNFND